MSVGHSPKQLMHELSIWQILRGSKETSKVLNDSPKVPRVLLFTVTEEVGLHYHLSDGSVWEETSEVTAGEINIPSEMWFES